MTVASAELLIATIDELHPTQMTAGFGQIDEKVKKWQKLGKTERAEQMRRVAVPGVKGPKGSFYLTDHHHEALALQRLGEKTILISLLEDLSDFTQEAFWIYLDHRDWVHCYDVNGSRRPFKAMPKLLKDMHDDPYRTLAAKVRQHGGFAKSDMPFLEFLWANYFRDTIKPQLVAKQPADAFKKAMKLAKEPGASCLPGFAAPS